MLLITRAMEGILALATVVLGSVAGPALRREFARTPPVTAVTATVGVAAPVAVVEVVEVVEVVQMVEVGPVSTVPAPRDGTFSATGDAVGSAGRGKGARTQAARTGQPRPRGARRGDARRRARNRSTGERAGGGAPAAATMSLRSPV